MARTHVGGPSLDGTSQKEGKCEQDESGARKAIPSEAGTVPTATGDETRSYFLNEVDGLQVNDGVLMIGR